MPSSSDANLSNITVLYDCTINPIILKTFCLNQQWNYIFKKEKKSFDDWCFLFFFFFFFCRVVNSFASEGVINPAAFPLLVTKCCSDSVPCLWVLLWPEGPTASHTSSDIDTVPPPHHSWHLIHPSRCYFRISNSQQGITGKCQCCVVLGHLGGMRETGKNNGGNLDR